MAKKFVKMSEKKELTAKALTETWLKLMTYGGCNPKNQDFINRLINLFFIISCALVILLSMIKIFIDKCSSLSYFTKIVIIIVGYFQVTIKFITCRIKSRNLSNMIDIIRDEFWPLEQASDEIKIKIIKIYKFIKIITNLYMILILGSIISVIGVAMQIDDNILPLDFWMPKTFIIVKRTPYYEMFYAFQIIFMFAHDLFCVIPLDSLFATMIGLVYCQYNIIKDNLLHVGRNQNIEYNYEIIRRCIEHHNLLLRFSQMLEAVYSNAILPIIGSGLCLATLNLYAIVMEDDNSLKGMFIILYICIFSQLFFYCQAGQIIQNEAESIGEEAFNCNWTDLSNKKVTNSLQLIILRSQKRCNITAGGFMILNLENFASVVQTSFSFLTFLESFKS